MNNSRVGVIFNLDEFESLSGISLNKTLTVCFTIILSLGLIGSTKVFGQSYEWKYAESIKGDNIKIVNLDQTAEVDKPDIVPQDPQLLRNFIKGLASDATIYGLPAVRQYQEMYRQAIDTSSTSYVGFNSFSHDRVLAGPEYKKFQAPNTDTLYSNAWLDLRSGPVLISIPETSITYYTLQFLDMYANSSNIGTRTFGNKGGSYLIVPPQWAGTIPEGVNVFRVNTPYVWVLMRVFAQQESEVGLARDFQDSVKITPPAGYAVLDDFPEFSNEDALQFFDVLDFVIRANGYPTEEAALVYRFRPLNVGKAEPFDLSKIDEITRQGMNEGYLEAMKVISASSSQLGIPTGTGWNRIQKGVYGFNYFNRAVINYVGLGANRSEENYSFSSFRDVSGARLDGSRCEYSLTFIPPPVNAFWSLTLYETSSFHLYPNELSRHSISDRTSGLVFNEDGTLTIKIMHNRPGHEDNWLPAPSGQFFISFRTYLPRPELLSGKWLPPGIIVERSL